MRLVGDARMEGERRVERRESVRGKKRVDASSKLFERKKK
jgi:hypothetical protein